jgi:hypothetical protein
MMHVSFLPCILITLCSFGSFIFSFISGILFGTGPDFVPRFHSQSDPHRFGSNRDSSSGAGARNNFRRPGQGARYAGTTGLPMEMEAETNAFMVDFSFAVFLVFMVISFWVNRNWQRRAAA